MKILDLYCKQGGASRGYELAGFEVVGVDIEAQPRYPYEFVQADAIEYLQTQDLSRFSAIHASPPCQKHSRLNAIWRRDYPDLIAATREALIEIGLPYVIENVQGAPLEETFMLCGRMFGQRYFRHRYFETSFFVLAPVHVPHRMKAPRTSGLPQNDNEVYSFFGHFSGVREIADYIGCEWMNREGVANAIPPVYTEWIGRRIVEASQ